MRYTSLRNALLIVGLFVGASYGAYAFFMHDAWLPGDDGEIVASSTISGVVAGAEVIGHAAPPPEGYVKYTNERYGFSFYHTPQGKVTEFDEGQGAATIVLENEERVRGMQIFIVPYAEETISDERFYADVPSGVRENIEATTLGVLSVPAVTFTSVDEALGETREIWFIYKGYLYEITTFKGVGAWFAPIIQSWRFVR